MRELTNEVKLRASAELRASLMSNGSSCPGDNFIEINVLLDGLVRELYLIVDTDILPRWTKKADLVSSFLDNKPYHFGTIVRSLQSLTKPSKSIRQSIASLPSNVSNVLSFYRSSRVTPVIVPVTGGDDSEANAPRGRPIRP